MFEVLPKDTTSTALYAAVAVKTSRLRAFVKIEQHVEKARVKNRTTSICDRLLSLTCDGFVGCISKRMKTGGSSSTEAMGNEREDCSEEGVESFWRHEVHVLQRTCFEL